MSQLSPNYRADDAEGLSPEIIAYLDEHFLKQVENLDVSNPKLLVVFSGGNALGKTTLSYKIGHELKALVLENDAIKECLLEYAPDMPRDERNKVTWQYSMSLYKRLDELTPNGLVVRDGVIDWYYDRILPIFSERGYRLFVIAYDVSRERRMEQIMKRGDKSTISTERFIEIFDEHDTHQARFRQYYRSDVILTDENLFDHEMVVGKLSEELDKL